MNILLSVIPRGVRTWWLILLLALCILPPLLAQEVNVKIGGENPEQEKTNKDLASKLPADQAAAYLKNQNAWNQTSSIIQALAFFALPVGVVALVLGFRFRRQKLAHETMRLMIEKGLPVPLELINPPPPIKPPKNDLRRGLIWLGIGFGLLISARKMWEDDGPWALALVPVFIGGAYLICWLVGLMREQRGGDLWQGIFWTMLGIAIMVAVRSMEASSSGWEEMAEWWGVGLIPLAVGLAFLLHALVVWMIARRKLPQG